VEVTLIGRIGLHALTRHQFDSEKVEALADVRAMIGPTAGGIE